MPEWLRILAAVVLLGCVAIATGTYVTGEYGRSYSDRPSPSGGVVSHEPQSHPFEPNQQAGDQASGTEQNPFVVKVAPSPGAQPETPEQRREHQTKAAEDWWTVVFAAIAAGGTILLVFVTGGLWLATYRMWRGTLRAIEGEEKAAKAMSDLAETADRTAERQLRAYLFIENAWVKWPPGGAEITDSDRWHVLYRLKNYGATPAHKTRVKHVVEVVSWPPDDLPVPVEGDYFGTVAPNGDFIENDTTETEGIAIKGILTEEQAIMLVGRIDYVDAFSKDRWTEFCYYLTGRISDDGEMSIWDAGNESDQ